YMSEKNFEYVALIDPDDFVRWVFPRLFYSRIPRYEAIADQYGYTISTEEVAAVQNENDFLELITNVLDR
ncbi:MAG: ATPase, partial [Gammaproteobacteria bacterium]